MNNKSELAKYFNILSNEIRLCILTNLCYNGEKNVSELQTCSNASQSNVSQQLSKLKASGIIDSKKVGNEVFYKITENKVCDIIKLVMEELDV